jgi:hypothetical protein
MDHQQNTERLIRYLDSLGAESSRPRVMEYVLGLVCIVLLSMHLESNSFPVERAIAKETRGCIAQYGPGERYARPKPEKCAPMVEAPSYILSMPVGQ